MLKQPSESSNRKAWRYFRKLLDNDEKYFALKTKGEPVEIRGSEGGRYFLYPNGQLARIDKDAPHLGKLVPSSQMPLADYFSALYIWITQREKEFRNRWGCGAVSIFYNHGELTTERGDRVAGIYDIPHNEMLGTCDLFFTGSVMSGSVAGATYLIPDGIYQLLINEGGDNTDGES